MDPPDGQGPKHQSRIVQDHLDQKGVHQMDFPAQSPDLAPAENVIKLLKDRVEAHNSRNAAQLERALKNGWSEVPLSQIRNIINSMPDRIKAVLNAKGEVTPD